MRCRFLKTQGGGHQEVLHYVFACEIVEVIVSIKYSVPSIIYVLSLKSKDIFNALHYNARIDGRCSAYWGDCVVPQ